ncbi:PepSY-associated TM helix domain-containing protein [Hymenobacter terrenus]|uniref:PepSY-associated TM helix domain-containing protein n=1 Tax=Hymenobacter terrenus TaxID=1629124 RepID=UPI000619460D|nr:PepSY-associated TM helix domain-containing protein [Hymenobacter terrenus]
MTSNRRLFALHSWLGLLAGSFILIFFFTGALMVFREELNELSRPELFRVEAPAGQPPLSYDALYRAARRQEPAALFFSFRHLPQTPTETLEIRIYEAGEYGRLFVHPYTGQVLGKAFNSFTDALIILHYSFYLKHVGEALAGIFAICLLGSTFTGAVVYRQHLLKVVLFRQRLSWRSGRATASGLHRVLGVWALLFQLLLASSGLWLSWDAFDLKKILSSDEKPAAAFPLVAANLDELLRVAGQQVPGLRPTRINFPRKPEAPVAILGTSPQDAWLWGTSVNKAEFTNVAGPAQLKKLTRQQDLTMPEKLDLALRTLHFGQYGGLGIKVLYSLLALSSAIITITGFILWVKGPNLRPRARRGQVGRLPQK